MEILLIARQLIFQNNPEDLIYMNIAIITGASSGLGREFALQICQNYASEIDEIWLLARRKEPLLALAQESVSVLLCRWTLQMTNR